MRGHRDFRWRVRSPRARPEQLARATNPDAKVGDFVNACTLRAIKEVSRRPDADVIKAFLDSGWVPGHGTYDGQWAGAVPRLLGLKVVPVKFNRLTSDDRAARDTAGMPSFEVHRSPAGNPEYLRAFVEMSDPREWRTPRPTLAKVADALNEGVFLVSVNKHAFAMRDGVVLDGGGRRGSGRKVMKAFWVVNAPQVEPGRHVRFVRGVRQARPRSWRKAFVSPKSPKDTAVRFMEAREFCHGKDVTPERLLKNTCYTQADLDYDLRLGHVVLED